MRFQVIAAACAALVALPAFAAQKADPEFARGRYVVEIGGCNDCHTPGYGMSGGKVPQSQWLVGDSLGWQGPWGTTYPPNLRLYFQSVDLRAMYRFIRHLGPAGKPRAAEALAAGKMVTVTI